MMGPMENLYDIDALVEELYLNVLDVGKHIAATTLNALFLHELQRMALARSILPSGGGRSP